MTVENKPIDTDIKRYQQKYAANIKERYRQVKSIICAWYYDLWLSSPFVNTRRFLCFGFVSFHFIWFGLYRSCRHCLHRYYTQYLNRYMLLLWILFPFLWFLNCADFHEGKTITRTFFFSRHFRFVRLLSGKGFKHSLWNKCKSSYRYVIEKQPIFFSTNFKQKKEIFNALAQAAQADFEWTLNSDKMPFRFTKRMLSF